MNFLRSTILSCFLFLGAILGAETYNDYNFQQERMLVTPESVIVISSFDNVDYITAYSHRGVLLWNATFHAKILSWQIQRDLIFVFSKDRLGFSTYLTCIDRYTGEYLWQKP